MLRVTDPGLGSVIKSSIHDGTFGEVTHPPPRLPCLPPLQRSDWLPEHVMWHVCAARTPGTNPVTQRSSSSQSSEPPTKLRASCDREYCSQHCAPGENKKHRSLRIPPRFRSDQPNVNGSPLTRAISSPASTLPFSLPLSLIAVQLC